MEILKTRRDIAPTKACFVAGPQFDAAVVALGADSNGYSIATSFSRSSAAPGSSDTITTVSTRDSDAPIYVWLNGTAMYWYSAATQVYLHNSTVYMFNHFANLQSLDFSGIRSSRTTNMNHMFNGCTRLETLDLSSFNTAAVTRMDYMFSSCYSLTLLILSFNTAAVTRMESMFSECNNLTTIISDTDFDCSSNPVTGYMFHGCTSLVGGSGTAYSSSHTDGEYARIDNPPDAPGYFTLKP